MAPGAPPRRVHTAFGSPSASNAEMETVQPGHRFGRCVCFCAFTRHNCEYDGIVKVRDESGR